MPKVPVMALVRTAYADVGTNRRGLARVASVWFLILCAFMMLTWGSLAMLALGLPSFLAMVAVAVAWHRHVIEGAALTGWMAPLDGRVLRYLWRSFLCTTVTFIGVGFALVGLTALLLMFTTGIDDIQFDNLINWEPMYGLVGIPVFYVFARLQLVLPAAAIRDTVTGFVSSWRATRGNGWRLVLGMALVTIPIGAATRLLTGVLTDLAIDTGSIALRLLTAVVSTGGDLLGAALLAAFLSQAYLFFRQQAATQV
ncbi:MAG: hypothetical protein U1E45_03585 [Geminicoccaceae bacterium]